MEAGFEAQIVSDAPIAHLHFRLMRGPVSVGKRPLHAVACHRAAVLAAHDCHISRRHRRNDRSVGIAKRDTAHLFNRVIVPGSKSRLAGRR
jgi:hypothetical protein